MKYKSKSQLIGLLLGIVLFLLVLLMPTPEGLSLVGKKVLAVTILMVVFWMTEAIPIPMTSLLPIILFPLVGITGKSGQNDIVLFENYGYSTVFLILGVSFLSTAMVKWNLHKRIALWITLKVGSKPSTMVLGFILATTLISMWMSNTTAAAMMLPVAISVATSVASDNVNFRKALVICIPWAATLGGMGTIVGSTTNPTGVAIISETLGIDITFIDWLKFGLPFVIVLVPLMWFYLVKFYKLDKLKEMDHSSLVEEYNKLGDMSGTEKRIMLIFVIGVVLWMTKIFWDRFLPFTSDETVALLIALLCVTISTPLKDSSKKNGEPILSMKEALDGVPWNAYLLLGGSMVMGLAFTASGCSEWLAGNLIFLSGLSPIIVIIVISVFTAVVTELTTNAVVVASFLPVLGSLGSAIGMNPFILMVTCLMASNNAYMLPSATPPNAIAYATGEIEIKDLVKAGIGMKVIHAVVFPIILMICINVFGLGA
ncbi:solute carrier family 13 (sodium-dependent dicarboxylate transporter), member 2/3/5 [Anaerosphaera aminiphila DSM 21120]|uniref:Sodium-dependent dicarboxylate transporter SdcS n=1 Tax=Anaerosphaera aminiphila DSM 21120 TaxID=1120995 RepID=A0A1M5U7V6_9FIRM|nr:DASS family sodium-coupled anion symporter [Anaerosphaera aminiphila]SHH58936.1 solute carrier family 13 (sodium-dependent dicarboxylate transporter), member 2/3/5 [Anaerosphaera aminiphila DSM 21120]